MFKEWGFLLTELWVLLALAALIGLFAGWVIWGRRVAVTQTATASGSANAVGHGVSAKVAAAHKAELDAMAAKLDRCRSDGAKKDARLKEVETELDELRAQAAFTAPLPAFVDETPEDDDQVAKYDQETGITGTDYDGDGIIEGVNEGTKPATLDGPREGGADDLKRIKGVGPAMEKLCNTLGFYHFDQIAAWTPDEVAWVDANLEGFKGRVTRDDWVPQAKLLAAGGETEFSKKVDDGDVY